MRRIQVTWPSGAIKGHAEYSEIGRTLRLRAMADVLTCWANVCAGNHPPDGFGMFLVEVGDILSCGATSDELSAFYKSIMAPVVYGRSYIIKGYVNKIDLKDAELKALKWMYAVPTGSDKQTTWTVKDGHFLNHDVIDYQPVAGTPKKPLAKMIKEAAGTELELTQA